MKLVNPTDEVLDDVFAIDIAGWHNRLEGDALCWYNAEGKFMGGRNDGEHFSGVPRFTKSADLVLPWLEKEPHWSSECVDFAQSNPLDKYYVRIFRRKLSRLNDTMHVGSGRIFARTAVICLLRAHGIEVEFT